MPKPSCSRHWMCKEPWHTSGALVCLAHWAGQNQWYPTPETITRFRNVPNRRARIHFHLGWGGMQGIHFGLSSQVMDTICFGCAAKFIVLQCCPSDACFRFALPGTEDSSCSRLLLVLFDPLHNCLSGPRETGPISRPNSNEPPKQHFGGILHPHV